jgi:hypothetical protein
LKPSHDLFRDRHILITGASSGIGEVFARRLAARGAHLVLTARRVDQLEILARDLSSAYGVRVQAIGHDLAAPGAARGLQDRVLEAGLEIDILINNAGFGLYGRFWEAAADRYEQMVRLNVEALTTLTRLFLPGMIERGRGGILNVASTASFQPVPGFAVYAASKAYVLSFSEALAAELRGTGVRVLALCPGATRTEFQQHSGTEGFAPEWIYDTPELVVDRAIRAFESGTTVRISGATNWIGAFAARFFPRSVVATAAGLTMKRARHLTLKRE